MIRLLIAIMEERRKGNYIESSTIINVGSNDITFLTFHFYSYFLYAIINENLKYYLNRHRYIMRNIFYLEFQENQRILNINVIIFII